MKDTRRRHRIVYDTILCLIRVLNVCLGALQLYLVESGLARVRDRCAPQGVASPMARCPFCKMMAMRGLFCDG